MAGDFTNYGDERFYSNGDGGLVESKLEVVMLEDEDNLQDGDAINEEETTLQFYDTNNEAYVHFNGVDHNHFEEADPLQDPLQLDDNEIQLLRQQEQLSTSFSLPKRRLRSTPAPPPLSQIHPFALKIQRLNPDSQKLSPDGKKNGVVPILNNTSRLPPPPSSSSLPFTMADVESTVRTFIDNCVSSRKDPRCRHKFYFTCHSVLNEALESKLISPEKVDSYWKKFDEWAASSASYRVGDHYMLQYRHRANDPDEDPPKPKKLTRQRKSQIKIGNVNPGRLLRGMMRNLEASVKMYVLNSKYLPLRDDLYSRVKFYQTWHKYYNAGSELFLDFYWNALINRSIEYYDYCDDGLSSSSTSASSSNQTKSFIPSSTKVALPPSPKKMKINGLPPPPEPVSILKPCPPVISTAPSSSSPKSLDMDRMVKLAINNCIESGKDPRTCHKFYWTIYRALETVQSLNLSLRDIDLLWRKYDDWAGQAYSKREPFVIMKIHQLYDDVSELPPPARKVNVKRPEELKMSYPVGLNILLERRVKGFILALNITENNLRDNLKQRRLFLETYVYFVEPQWKDELIDIYWNKLVTDTVYTYKITASLTVPPPPTPAPSSRQPRPESASTNIVQVPKKFDMDRLIKLCINSCIESGKDPKATHKFYWTIHRSLETVASLNLSQKDIDLLWKKYDDWAEEAFVTRKLFKLNFTNHSEYYGDVSELPPPPVKFKPPKPKSLKKPNGLSKWLEKVLREFIIAKNSSRNNFRFDLESRRKFLQNYVDFVPTNKEHDFVIDIYWRRLLKETIEDYKYYLQSKAVASDKISAEEAAEIMEIVKPSSSSSFVSSTSTSSHKTDPPIFSMDYLVKKVINSCVKSNVDPRLCHKFYWTIHRCIQETQRRNPTVRTTKIQLDAIWGQYDAMASKAFIDKNSVDAKYCMLEENLKKNYSYFHDVSQLPPPLPDDDKPCPPSITQLFPNCPKSSALKKYLEQKLRQIVTKSPLVNFQNNYILNNMNTRREFFLGYAHHVKDMSVEAAENLVSGYWKRLMMETRNSLKKWDNLIAPGPSKSSSSSSTFPRFTMSQVFYSGKKKEEVPCIEID